MTEKIIDYNKSEINMSPIKEWKDLRNTEESVRDGPDCNDQGMR